MTPRRPKGWTRHAVRRWRERVDRTLGTVASRGWAQRQAVFIGCRNGYAGWRWRDWVLVTRVRTGQVVTVWPLAYWQQQDGRMPDAAGDVSD